MKHIIFTLLLLLGVGAVADEPMLKATSYKFVQATLGKSRAHFVEFGSESCYSCQEMGKKLYKIKKAHPEHNIEFINVKEERQAAYDFKIRMIPTQLIFDEKGKEVYRHIGILQDDEIQALLKKHKI